MRPVPTAFIASAALVSLVTLSVSCSRDTEQRGANNRIETRTLDLAPGGQVLASTFNGSIVVEGWDRQEVSLVAKIRERREGEIRFTTESKDGKVEIRAERTNQRERTSINIFTGYVEEPEEPGASYTLQIPKKAMLVVLSTNGRIEARGIDNEIDLTTENASITVEEIGAKARLTTSNAWIRANSVKGDVTARASNSSLKVIDVAGSADLRTSNAQILARGIKGKADIITSNAPIIAENIESDLTAKNSKGGIEIQKVLGAVDITISNGPIKADGLDGKGRGIRLSTSNGNIDVALGKAKGELEATNGGEQPVVVEVPNVRPTHQGNTAKANIGASEQPIVLKTSNGRITVRQ
jgi:DUF4097 and DUF4098 domain-containing protein YvlB